MGRAAGMRLGPSFLFSPLSPHYEAHHDDTGEQLRIGLRLGDRRNDQIHFFAAAIERQAHEKLSPEVRVYKRKCSIEGSKVNAAFSS
jgi:hypothetical protein